MVFLPFTQRIQALFDQNDMQITVFYDNGTSRVLTASEFALEMLLPGTCGQRITDIQIPDTATDNDRFVLLDFLQFWTRNA